MQPICQRFIVEYESIAAKLRAAQDHELIDELVEIRKILNELMAIACRSLSDNDRRLFKYTCEEIEERFLIQ